MQPVDVFNGRRGRDRELTATVLSLHFFVVVVVNYLFVFAVHRVKT
jgi:hypothetical protein